MKRLLVAIPMLWFFLHLVGYIYLAYHPDPQFNRALGIDPILYQQAAKAWQDRAPLYVEGEWPKNDKQNWRYHPLMALVLQPTLWFSPQDLIALCMLVFGVAYVLGVLVWWRVLPDRAPAYLLVALASTDAIGALAYGNISLLLMTLTGLACWLGLRSPRAAGVLVALIAFSKPQWALAAVAFLFVIKDFRSFFWFALSAAITYALGTFGYIALSGGQYGIDSLQAYARFLGGFYQHFPWEGTEAMFNTMQNSVYQTLLRYGLPAPQVLNTLTQVLLVLWGLIALWLARRNPTPQRALAAAFVIYLVGMLCLPQLEELILSGVIFVFLVRYQRHLFTWLFLPILLIEIPLLISISFDMPWLDLYSRFPLILMGGLLLLALLTRYLLNTQIAPPVLIGPSDHANNQ